MRRPLSIRSRLLGTLSAVILVYGGAVFFTTVLGARQAVRRLAGEIVTQKTDRLGDQLDGFFRPVRTTLDIMADWTAEGLINPDEPDDLRRRLEPVLVRVRAISSVLVAHEEGHEFMLLRSGDTWTSRLTRPAEWGSRSLWTEWPRGTEPPEGEMRETGYDPRRRPWFQGAMERRGEGGARRVHWTLPYIFFTTKQPGITLSVAVPTPGGHVVLGLDILLEEISNFTMGLGAADHSTIFVLTEDDRVIGLPPELARRSAAERAAALLKHPDELGVRVLGDAVKRLGADVHDAAPFPSDGSTWWGGRRRYELAPGSDLEITVAVAEQRLLHELDRIRDIVLGVAAAVLLLALWRAFALARHFSRPIEALVEESDRISRGDLAPGPPLASNVTELRRLADAHDRMRTAVGKLLHLEGELRIARKIQQDTFPRQLPTLAGFDCAGLSLPAAETGGDTYDAVGIGADGRITTGDAARALFLVADATGHGVGPALSVTQVRAMLRMAARTGRPLVEIVRHLNEQLAEDLAAGRFVTMWLGELDVRASTLTSFSAGQGPLLRYDAKAGAFEERDADAPPLGILKTIEMKPVAPVPMRPGDFLLVLSDGFYEAAAPDGELFGVERVRKIAEERRAEPAERIVAALLAEVDRHLAGAPAADDRTALLIKRL